MERNHSSSGKPCAKCAASAPFDSEVAYRRLAHKHMQLAGLVASYVSQAGMERGARLNNAAIMAEEAMRIVGGKPVAAEEFPECCLVGRTNSNGTIGWFCSGVLIHPRVVLSAGHCMISNNVANVVALKAAKENFLNDAEIVPVQRIIAHPLYLQTQQFHDISVLILRRPATVPPVALGTTQEINAAQKTILAGFGNDDVKSTRGFGVKREVTVDIRAILRNPGDDLNAEEQRFGFDARLEFVAGGRGFDSCNGDSGGPAYIQVNGVRRLAGTTSRGIEATEDRCGDGGIYSRVDANLDFIKSTAGAAGVQF